MFRKIVYTILILFGSAQCMKQDDVQSDQNTDYIHDNEVQSVQTDQVTEDAPKNITITIGDYSRDIAWSQAKTIGSINDQLDFEKESNTVSLNTINNATILDRLLAFDLDYSLELSDKEIIALFEVADYLGFKHETLRQLTLMGKKMLSKEQQPEAIRSGLYLNSINSLINDRTLNSENHFRITRSIDKDNNIFYNLDLSNLNLDNLNGLERLCNFIDNNYSITHIILDGNNIDIIDINLLLELYPQLTTLFAEDCTIGLLKSSSKLPNRFNLFLNKSTIQHCSSFKMGEASHLNVEDSELSLQAEYYIQRAIRPTLFERHRHRLKTLYQSFITHHIWVVLPAALVVYPLELYTLEKLFGHIENPCYLFIDFKQDSLKTIFNKSLIYALPVSSVCLLFAYLRTYPNNLIHQYVPSTLIGINPGENNSFKTRFLKRCKQTLNKHL